MKNSIFLLFILMAVLFQGCIVKSLHPFFTEADLVFKPELLHSWIDDDGNSWVISPVKEKPNTYEMHYTKGGIDAVFIVYLFTLDEKLYMDFFPIARDGDGDIPIFDFHLLPTHSLAKVEMLSAEEVRIKWFNESWLATLFRQNRIKIAHEVIPDEMSQDEDDQTYVLTASTEELQKFIRKYADEEAAFDDDNTVKLILKRSL